MNAPPQDWTDRDAWNRYFDAELLAGPPAAAHDFIVLRFLKLVNEKGGRVWFPGCGLDPYPTTYAERGCTVLATDFSPVAVKYQQGLAAEFEKRAERAEVRGALDVEEQDFTQSPPNRESDVVINCRAFQGLPPSAMVAAARRFRVAVRPGGACIVDTVNVQGGRRNLIEDSLVDAGFYIPFLKSVRWYREELDATGLGYWMVLGRPRILARDESPPGQDPHSATRDQHILDSFRAEFERRQQEEAGEVNACIEDPRTVVAYVVYATG